MDLFEGKWWVICVFELVKFLVVFGFEGVGEWGVLVVVGDIVVGGVGEVVELGFVVVEKVDVVVGDVEVEVVVFEVVVGGGGLDDYFFVGDGVVGEGEFGRC